MLATVSRPSTLIAAKVLAAIFDDVAVAAGRADPADDCEDQVLGRDAEAEAAVDADFQRLRRPHQQRLRREHMLDLARADAEGERAERAMRGGMAVAADQGGAGQGEALLRPDDVDDALLGGERVDVGHAEFARRCSPAPTSCVALCRIFDRQRRRRCALDPRGGRQVVVGDGERQVGPAHLTPGQPQPFERLRRGHLVDEMPVDIDEARPVLAARNDMRVPDLLVQGARAFAHPQHPRFIAISSR